MKCTQIKGIIVKNRTEGDNKGKEGKAKDRERKTRERQRERSRKGNCKKE